MKIKSLLLSCCVALLSSMTTHAQTPAQLQQIDSLMRTANDRGIFNGTILIAQNGNVIYNKAWGYASKRF